jgi:hypothetical protein
MGFSRGPKVVTDGLVLALDAANVKSFRGEPTTNLFTHYGSPGQGSGGDVPVTFSIQGSGTFIRLGHTQVYGGYLIKPNDVVYRYDLGSNGCHYHGNAVSITAGSYAIFSFDYYVSPETTIENNFLANFENYGGGAFSGSISANGLKGVWQSVSFVSGPASSNGTLAMFLYPGSCGPRFGNTGYILYKNPQVEFRQYATPFVNGTRGTTVDTGGGWADISVNSNHGELLNGVTFDNNNFGSLSFDGVNDYINFSTNIQSGYTSASYEFFLETGNITTSEYRQIYIQENSTWIALYSVSGVVFFGIDLNNGSGWFDGNGGWNTGSRTTSTITSNTKYHLVYTWSGTSVKVYLNGVLQSTTSTLQASNGRQNVTQLGAGSTPRRIGSRNNQFYWNNKIYKTSFYNRELTSQEVIENFNATKSRYGL